MIYLYMLNSHVILASFRENRLIIWKKRVGSGATLLGVMSY